MYDEAIKAIEAQLLFKSKKSNLWYFAEKKSFRIEHKMTHLSCFIAGLFALQSKFESNQEKKKHFLELAEQIANTCHESYIRSGILLNFLNDCFFRHWNRTRIFSI